ncbi:MAG: M14 family metallopeptidase [Acidimicrobiia bacterium]
MTVRRVDAGPAGGFDIHRVDSGIPGPRFVVLGGVHGDETEGALAAGRLAASPPTPVRGMIDIVAVCHEAAFAADSRTSPLDGGNLARVFPGDPDGTPTARLAHHLFTEVLDGADFLIDLHTSGQQYDMPFLAGYRGQQPNEQTVDERAAIAFGADFVWRHPHRSEGRTVSVVEHAIYCESPGGGPTNQATVDAYVEGVLRVLAELAWTAETPPRRTEPQVRVTGGGNLDRDMVSVTHTGVFLADVARGDQVAPGRRLGHVIDVAGTVLEELVASDDGHVMALKRRSPVIAGDLVVCLASLD